MRAPVERWFHKGIATVVGGTPPNQIRNAGLVRQWRAGGCTLADAKSLYVAIRRGSWSEKAFEEHMEISVADFEADFSSLIEDYLS